MFIRYLCKQLYIFLAFLIFTGSLLLFFRIPGTKCHIKTTQTVAGHFTGWSDGLILSKWVVLGQNKKLFNVKSFRNIKWQMGHLKNYKCTSLDRLGTMKKKIYIYQHSLQHSYIQHSLL